MAWIDETHFVHNEIQVGEWMGPWNGKSYDYIDFKALLWAQDTMDGLVERWGNHPAVWGMEPVNEPQDATDQWALKIFYRNVRYNMRKKAPHVKFVFHDSGHLSPADWDDLFEDGDTYNVVLDNHYYRAWNNMGNTDVDTVCKAYKDHLEMIKGHKYEVMLGEWSLATDDCAFWLGHFNDGGSPGGCQWVDCPKPYLKGDLAVDMDRDVYVQGPFGTNPDLAKYGKCPIDSARFSHAEVAAMGKCIYESIDANIQAQTMWTFRNELEPRWSYTESYDQGLIPERKPKTQQNAEPSLLQ